MSGRLSSGTSGFGVAGVIGRSRVPSPAVSTTPSSSRAIVRPPPRQHGIEAPARRMRGARGARGYHPPGSATRRGSGAE